MTLSPKWGVVRPPVGRYYMVPPTNFCVTSVSRIYPNCQNPSSNSVAIFFGKELHFFIPVGHTTPVVRLNEDFGDLVAIRCRNNNDLTCARSEERRVGKECRSRWSRYHCEKKHG